MADIANIKMLVVEDNPRYSELLKESLMEFGYQDIEWAENAAQASEKLKTYYFDVIIADMYLGDDKKGGFSVVQAVKADNITSIVIILTANDNWLDCRQAFLEGTRDYLSKNMRGDVFEILHDSITAALMYAEQYGNRCDELWIEKNWDQLLQKYPHQHIAVMNNTVIDNDSDRETLITRIQDRKLPMLMPVIKHIAIEEIEKLPIPELIKRGEGDRIEFKSSFQCAEKEKNEDVQNSSLKTIAAFLNSKGGVLLIGVEDNGAISGLDIDYSLIKKRSDWDGFCQNLTNRIINKIGNAFMHYISVEPFCIESKEIAVIKVEKSHTPAFSQVKNKNGQKEKFFYIRANNTTRSLDVEETHNYLLNKIKSLPE